MVLGTLTSATHLPDENGNVAYIMGIIEDITTEREERRRMMQAEFCMDESADAISLLTRDGSYLYANNSYAELLPDSYREVRRSAHV